MNPHIYLYSPSHLEPWDRTTPWTTGIGGSETCHIEMSERLARRGLPVESLCPLPGGRDTKAEADPMRPLVWKHYEHLDLTHPGVFINFRDTAMFEQKLPRDKGQRYWFVAQDVDYRWTPEALAEVDRYICLCQKHKAYTLARYPQLEGRVCVSSNGVRSEFIRSSVLREGLTRDPHRLIYASSPDRGLLFILRNWFRIKEAVPEATLRVFYGFENADKIGTPALRALKAECLELLKQDGCSWRGRIGQHDLYKEWAQAAVWFYPSDWPETSCISCMDAQALGAVPVTNRYWAVAENVRYGCLHEGIPQKSPLVGANMIRDVISLLTDPPDDATRTAMQNWALARFDWERVVDQWLGWINEDLKES